MVHAIVFLVVQCSFRLDCIDWIVELKLKLQEKKGGKRISRDGCLSGCVSVCMLSLTEMCLVPCICSVMTLSPLSSQESEQWLVMKMAQ